MRDLLFGATGEQAAAVRVAARACAFAFVAEQRALVALFAVAAPERREFVAGEVACLLHVSPATGAARLELALRVMGLPRLVAALEAGAIGVPHALALLAEIEPLDAPHAAAVLAAVLDGPADGDGRLDATPGQLRSAAKRAAILLDPEAARTRHEQAKKTAGVRARPATDGMGQVVIDCTAVESAVLLAAVRARAAAMSFERKLTEGQKQVAAILHALTCDRVGVQAVIECPAERALDLHAAAGAAVWTVDLRMPVAVALGLSDHPAVLSGYGPIGADQARALLPQADLVRACVDTTTGEVLTADAPVRRKTWTRGDPDKAAALRAALIAMATTASSIPDLSTDGYVPSEALGRLVDLRDVHSVFPGDATSARRCERDHRLPHPLGRTEPGNLQNSRNAGTAPSTTAGPPGTTTTAPSPGAAPAAASTTADPPAPHRPRSSRAAPCPRSPNTRRRARSRHYSRFRVRPCVNG